MAAILLILDLDETLIHWTMEPLGRPADFRAGTYPVYVRPGAGEFIAFCRTHFRVAVWTSSTELYAQAIVGELFGTDHRLEFIWTRERCTEARHVESWTLTPSWEKDLAKLRDEGFALEQILVVDDSARAHRRNFRNLIPVLPFLGGIPDRELSRLARYLPSLKSVADVRAIDKRAWRTQLSD